MSDTLYIQLDSNILIRQPHVCLQDIARLSCSNPKILNRIRVMPVINLDPASPGRYVMSSMDLVEMIQKKEPSLTVTPLGQTDFILTYQNKSSGASVLQIIKVTFVCLITFFGSAFSIMTFNADVDVPGLFSQLYQQVMGTPDSGFTTLEISYSIGLGAGVLFFFNHFSRKKLSADPTPMQIQMRKYEDDVNTTITEDINRRQAQKQQTHKMS